MKRQRNTQKEDDMNMQKEFCLQTKIHFRVPKAKREARNRFSLNPSEEPTLPIP